MKKVILYIAMSLDGFIADKNGCIDWLVGDGSDNENIGSYDRFIETIDTIVLGYKTYNQIITELSPDFWVYSGKKTYVITHNKEYKSSDEIIFTDKELTSLILGLKNEDGKDIWVCGGSSIVNQLIDMDLIDKFVITIIPTILGRGIRLFCDHERELQLKLINNNIYNGMVELVYESRK